MQYDFGGSFSSFLAMQQPRKPIQIGGAQDKTICRHSGEDEVQYSSFLDAVNDLAQAFKFLPQYDQLLYEFGGPVDKFSQQDFDLSAYADALLEFCDTSTADQIKITDAENLFTDIHQDIPETWQMERIIVAKAIVLDPTLGKLLRYRATRYLANCINNCPFGAFSKQSEIRNTEMSFQFDGDTSPIELGAEHVVEGTEKFFVDGTETELVAGEDYTIDYDKGTITFTTSGIANGSIVRINYDFKLEKIWGQGMGVSYSNLEFSPNGSDWNLIEGVNADDGSVCAGLVPYFSSFVWGSIRDAGGSEGYYHIAKDISGDISANGTSSMTPEQSFYLMCSMLESRDRVLGVFKDIFGDDPSVLTDDEAVIDHITTWLASFTKVDPHNLGVLKMFFEMQTDFINTVDAYMNCSTYWGGSLTAQTSAADTDIGGFAGDLISKVNTYIGTLSGTQHDAASALLSKWQTPCQRWDNVSGQWTAELTPVNADWHVNDSGSWVEFFQDRMDEHVSKGIIRHFVARIHDRSETREYKAKMEEYEEKKWDEIQQEIFLRQVQAKKAMEQKKLLKALMGKKRRPVRSFKATGRNRGSRLRSVMSNAGASAQRSHGSNRSQHVPQNQRPAATVRHTVSQSTAAITANPAHAHNQGNSNSANNSQRQNHAAASHSASPRPPRALGPAPKKNDKKVA